MLEKALLGKYASAEEMREDLIHILNKPTHSQSSAQNLSKKQPSATRQTRRGQQQVTKKKQGRWLETWIIVTIISLLYVLYVI